MRKPTTIHLYRHVTSRLYEFNAGPWLSVHGQLLVVYVKERKNNTRWLTNRPFTFSRYQHAQYPLPSTTYHDVGLRVVR